MLDPRTAAWGFAKAEQQNQFSPATSHYFAFNYQESPEASKPV